jgi:hypothetical protein
MDADFEWIAAIAFGHPDIMWVSPLQRDRDVVAQLEISCKFMCTMVRLTLSMHLGC